MLETNSITIDGIIQRIKTAATTGQEKKEIIVKEESLLSYGQLSIWLAENLDPSKDNNIVARAVNLTNFNRVPALIAAVKRSLNNHTILKTVCDSHLGEIIQKICPFEIHPDCFDGRNMTGPELLQAIHAYAYRPYQLSDGSLVRAGIYALENRAVLVLSFHHLVVDFWSMEVLLKEIFDFLYLQEVPDITPDTTYFAYVKEQRELLAFGQGKKGVCLLAGSFIRFRHSQAVFLWF